MINVCNIINEALERKLDEEFLFEMTNVRGDEIKIADVGFSFYFSSKNDVNHGMRVKVKWNPSKIGKDLDGYFEMHGDYKYYHSPNSKNLPSKRDIKKAREFLKEYKVLFAAVWENILSPYYLEAFLRMDKKLNDIISNFKLDKDIIDDLNSKIKHEWDLDILEKEVRKNNLFNMND